MIPPYQACKPTMLETRPVTSKGSIFGYGVVTNIIATRRGATTSSSSGDNCLIYDVLGAVISVPIVVSLGYLFGAQLEALIRYLGGLERMIAIVALLSIGIYASRHLLLAKARESKA